MDTGLLMKGFWIALGVMLAVFIASFATGLVKR